MISMSRGKIIFSGFWLIMKKQFLVLVVLFFVVGCSGVQDQQQRISSEENTENIIVTNSAWDTEEPTETSPSTEIVTTVEPLILPEGRLIFTTRPGGILWLLNLPQMTKTKLYSQEETLVSIPKFFPDGENIAFLWDIGNDRGDFDLYVGDINGTEPVLLIEDLFQYAISPNGDAIVFVRETSRSTFSIFLFDLETKIVNQLTQDGRYKTDLQWSPNGKRIAYYVDEDSLGLINFNIQDEVESKVLIEGNVYDYGISWASNNNMIAFPNYRDELMDISVIDIDTTEPLIFTSPDGMCVNPMFIPKKNQVIADCRALGSWNVFLLDIDSGEYSQLTNFKNASKEYTTLSSSLLLQDDFILFSYWEGEPTDDVLDLYTVSLDGTGLTQLTEGLNISSFDWFREDD